MKLRTLASTLVVGISLCLASPARATTGGDEPVKVLGYALEDGKLYFLRIIDDGSEALAQLSYLVLHGPRAGTVIPVSSWERDVAERDNPHLAFEEKVRALERRLRPGKAIDPQCSVEANVLAVEAHDASEWDPSWDKRYRLAIEVAHPERPDKTQTIEVTAYGPRVEVVTEMRVPDRNVAVVVVRYFAFAYEHGYSRDIAVVVPLSDRAERAGANADAVEYVPFPEMGEPISRFMDSPSVSG